MFVRVRKAPGHTESRQALGRLVRGDQDLSGFACDASLGRIFSVGKCNSNLERDASVEVAGPHRLRAPLCDGRAPACSRRLHCVAL